MDESLVVGRRMPQGTTAGQTVGPSTPLPCGGHGREQNARRPPPVPNRKPRFRHLVDSGEAGRRDVADLNEMGRAGRPLGGYIDESWCTGLDQQFYGVLRPIYELL